MKVLNTSNFATEDMVEKSFMKCSMQLGERLNKKLTATADDFETRLTAMEEKC
jgi:hypothetical protein